MHVQTATLLMLLCLAWTSNVGWAQESPTVADPKAHFDALNAEWKQLLSNLRELRTRFRVAKPADRAKLREEYESLLARAEQKESPLMEAAEAYYLTGEDGTAEAGKLLAALAQDRIIRDDYELGARVAEMLIDHDYPEPGLLPLAGIAETVICEFDKAEAHFAAGEAKQALNEQSKAMRKQIPELRELWAKEATLREKEAAADDLPRVELATNRGTIVVELFEDQAPNTVANFISLVESGKYDGLSFHRVLGGFMMQGGDPKGDGSGGPGYTIDCECVRPDHRDHFRGSLSMAHAGRDTGGQQFFITFQPTLHLNGKHTVFGRVIDGIDVLAKIRRREPNDDTPADVIKSAKVLRKRPHEYKPVTKPDPRG